MEEIEQKAMQTYEKNLEFFAKNHIDVFKKIQAYNGTIENAPQISRYDLEYMKNYFDVKDIKSGHYLYSDNSDSVSTKLSQRVTFSKDSYIFDGFPLYHNYENAIEKLDDKALGLEGIFPIMTYYLDNTNSKDNMKSIDKFIIIGTGLGLHIPLIDKKINAKEYLIIENDLELFNLSLFCTPYYEFEKNVSLSFSIAEDENSFVHTFGTFLAKSWFLNRYLKYSYFPAHSNKTIKLIQSVLSSQVFIVFQYKTFLNKQLKPLEYINNEYNIVDLSKHLSDTAFSSKPSIVIGAGPSLQKNIEWLKKNHDKFIVIAVSSSLKLLYENNITPDLVVHLDGFDAAINLFNNFPVQEFLKNSLLLFGSFAPTNVRKMFKKEQCFFLEEDTFYFDGYTSKPASCVGSTSLLHSIMLDSREIYLLGLDFAVDSKTGRTHSEGHVTKKQIDLSTKDELKSSMSYQKNIFPVTGNFDGTVYTNASFHASVQKLHSTVPKIKRDYQNIYNLNSGAKLTQTTPLQIDDINTGELETIDKNLLNVEILNTLTLKSSQNLSADDIKSLKKRVEIAKEIKSYILKYQNSCSISNADSYLDDLLGIVSKILHHKGRESDNLILTYTLFFQYSLPIIMDLLNTKNLKNTKRHIKKLDKLLVKEMLLIESIYEKTIEEFILSRKL